MNHKANLRMFLGQRRDALSRHQVVEASARIEAHILELPEIDRAESIFAYVSVGNEVATRGLIGQLLELGKVVAVPRMTADGLMCPVLLESIEKLSPGRFGVPEPNGERLFEGVIDVCLAPGVAFTLAGARLGRGGGHYDRFLDENQLVLAIGLAYQWQIIEPWPMDEHDRPVQMIATEGGMVRM